MDGPCCQGACWKSWCQAEPGVEAQAAAFPTDSCGCGWRRLSCIFPLTRSPDQPAALRYDPCEVSLTSLLNSHQQNRYLLAFPLMILLAPEMFGPHRICERLINPHGCKQTSVQSCHVQPPLCGKQEVLDAVQGLCRRWT